MENRGIEPRLLGCRPSVLPLSLVPQCGCGGGNRTHLVAAYETAVCSSSSSPHQKSGPGSWSRTSGLSIIGRVLNQLSFSRMEPRARIELASLLYRSGASPAMLTGLMNLEPAERVERSSDAYHASALPLSYTGWSRRADSNRHLSVTRARFCPLNYLDFGTSGENRIIKEHTSKPAQVT